MHPETVLRRRSYAKINLHLKVPVKRPDSMHELFSLFAPVRFYDYLIIRSHYMDKDSRERLDSNLHLHLRIKFAGFLDEHDAFAHEMRQNSASYKLEQTTINLALRSLMQQLQYSEDKKERRAAEDMQNRSWQILLIKRIPSQAGLGGGSSNAAAVLLSVAEMYPQINPQTLAKAALKVGADVPFFLYGRPSFWGGVGDIFFEDAPQFAGLPVIIIKPPWSSSTKQAYRDLARPLHDKLFIDNMRENHRNEAREINGLPFENAFPCFENDFAHVLQNQDRRYAEVMAEIEKQARPWLLHMDISGSGSAMYAILKQDMPITNMRQIKKDLQSRYPLTFMTQIH